METLFGTPLTFSQVLELACFLSLGLSLAEVSALPPSGSYIGACSIL